MSKIKRYAFPDLYQLIDGIEEAPSTREQLEAKAKHIACACYYYDIANEAENMTDEDLMAIVADPYYAHKVNMDDMSECPEYQAEQAETIRDSLREDGENV